MSNAVQTQCSLILKFSFACCHNKALQDAELQTLCIISPLSLHQDAELAWHFFLPGLTSGYMYYGGVEDMPVKQTVAANNAVAHGLKAINMYMHYISRRL